MIKNFLASISLVVLAGVLTQCKDEAPAQGEQGPGMQFHFYSHTLNDCWYKARNAYAIPLTSAECQVENGNAKGCDREYGKALRTCEAYGAMSAELAKCGYPEGMYLSFADYAQTLEKEDADVFLKANCQPIFPPVTPPAA